LVAASGALLGQSNAPARAGGTNPPGPVAVAAPAVLAPPPAATALPAPAVTEAPALPDAASASFWQRELATARRIVGGHTFDITALVRWHIQPTTPERPLKGWVLVVGTVGANTAYGWEVTGFIDGQRQPAPFIIRSPPTELAADFNRRRAAYRDLERRQSGLRSELPRAKEQLADTEAAFRRAGAFRVAGDLLDLRGQAVKDIEAELAATDEALRNFDTGGLDMNGPFVLRCFAMKTTLALDRRAVFDHGTVMKK
jgi:hypothetical protein